MRAVESNVLATESVSQALVVRGRVGEALRHLEVAAWAAARRADHVDAGGLWLAAGRLCRGRGRLVEAARAIGRATEAFEQADDHGGRALCQLDLAWVASDDDRLDAAASAVERVVAMALPDRYASLTDAAVWMGRYVASWRGDDDGDWPHPAAGLCAAGLPPRVRPDELPHWCRPRPAVQALARWVRARSGSVEARVVEAVPGPDESADDVFLWEVRLLEAAARGDARGVERTLGTGLHRAKATRQPLAALRLRLAAAESGLTEPWPATTRWSRVALPGLFRRRLAALAQRDAEVASGRPSSRVHAPAVALLDVVNQAPDERTALTRACAFVREQAGAQWVGVFAGRAADRKALANASGNGVAPGKTANSADAVRALVSYGGQAVGEVVVAPGVGAPRALAATLAEHLAMVSAASVHALSSSGGAPAGTVASQEILGASRAIDDVRRLVAQAAATPFPVLIEGESGTGKELAARAVHQSSDRRHRRFCAINCAALSDDLVEAELFGHVRGAFTGASIDRPGLFEDADGGTLFLDEVGELSLRAQAKLLRAVQEREVRRVGENQCRRVDVRLVCATNRLLTEEVGRGRFREDLYYRLAVIRIAVPPLRTRPEDIPVLVERFWREALTQTGGCASLSPDAVACLARRPWPGNVRELQNALAALAVRVPKRGRLGPADLDLLWPDASHACPVSRSLDDARAAFERSYVHAALSRACGRRRAAAVELGLTRQGLAKLMRRLGIEDVGR